MYGVESGFRIENIFVIGKRVIKDYWIVNVFEMEHVYDNKLVKDNKSKITTNPFSFLLNFHLV